MGDTELLEQVKDRIDSLSRERLKVVDDFLAYLQERESNEATEELLRIPGFTEALTEAEKGMASGGLTPVGELQRKKDHV